MTMETYQEILERFPRAFYLQLQGQGEPLMNENLVHMLEIAERQRRFTSVITNGSLWTEEKTIEILEAGVDVVVFSLDLCSPEEMERQRVGFSWEKVTENLRRVIRLRDRIIPDTAVGVSAVLFDSVYRDEERLESAVRRLDDLGIDFLFVDPLSSTETYRRSYPEDLGREMIEQQVRRRLVPFQTRCTVYEADQLNTLGGHCIWPWTGLYINHDGTISFCANNHRDVIGSIRDVDPLNLPDHVAARKDFRRGRVPEKCRTCQYLVTSGR